MAEHCITPPQVVAWAVARLRARGGGGALLDAACGTGGWARVARDVGATVTGCDIDPGANRDPALTVQPADLDQPWPFGDAGFDTVTLFEVLEHLENPFHALREAARVLRPGGELLLSVPNGGTLARRVRYLYAGSAHRPTPPRPAATSGPGAATLRHLHALTAVQVLSMLEDAGLEPVEVTTGPVGWRRAGLWPVAAAVRVCAAALLWRRRRRYRLGVMNRWGLLLAGGSLLVAAARPA